MARATRGVPVSVDVYGALARLRGMPKEASAEIRAAAKEIAGDEVPRVQAAARSVDAQGAAVASTVKVSSDRIPAIQAGGAKRVTASGAKAGSIVAGSEYGAETFKQFKAKGRSRWLAATLAADSDRMLTRWLAALDKVIEKYGGGD